MTEEKYAITVHTTVSQTVLFAGIPLEDAKLFAIDMAREGANPTADDGTDSVNTYVSSEVVRVQELEVTRE